jgi:hypothetical protein
MAANFDHTFYHQWAVIMNFAKPITFEMLMEPVAARLLGEPNERLSKPPKDVRYGTHGSMKIDCVAGQFYDHENSVGGGVIDLIKHKLGCDRGGALSWLRREGLLSAPHGSPSRSATTKPSCKIVVKPNNHGGNAHAIEAIYDYRDECGALLFQVVRYLAGTEPRFRQRRPGTVNGEWIWALGNTRRVLYRLPELIEAVVAGRTVYIPEGEKDCDNLCSLGFDSTTNPGGAGKWRPEYSECVRGADVVIVGDNDDPGRKHAEQVAVSLHGVVKRVRVFELAKVWPECRDKGDISDWIARGGTAAQLKSLIEALPNWKPTEGAAKAMSAVTPDSPSAASIVWPEMDEAACYGLVGDVVKTIEPHSEADPNAILIQFLVAIGNAIGRGPHYKVEGYYHYSKLFSVLVGATNDGRKGTSLGRVLQVMDHADPDWTQQCVQGGLVSGEGLIHHVRDPVFKTDKDGCVVEADRGVPDKRLLIDAQEFAAVLAVMEKPGNTLSATTRDAWGHKILRTLGKVSPDKATGSHISIIAHITEPELRRKLTRTEMANGYANRFLFAKVRRSKKLPHGGNLDEAEVIGSASAPRLRSRARARSAA